MVAAYLTAVYLINFLIGGVGKNICTKYLPRYDVVRNVDYYHLPYFRLTHIGTTLSLLFIIFQNDAFGGFSFVLYTILVGWIDTVLIELSMQLTGVRIMDVNPLYIVFVQCLVEGGFTYGMPLGYVVGLTNPETRSATMVVILCSTVNMISYKCVFLGRMDCIPGSTNVCGRRQAQPTLGWRLAEGIIILYFLILSFYFPQQGEDEEGRDISTMLSPHQQMKKQIIVLTACVKGVEMGLFFGLGTLLGHSMVDRGPAEKDKLYTELSLLEKILGWLFRVWEQIFSVTKCICLTYYFFCREL